VINNQDQNRERLRGIREFVREVAIPAESIVVETNCIPESIVDAMRKSGFLDGVSPGNMGVQNSVLKSWR